MFTIAGMLATRVIKNMLGSMVFESPNGEYRVQLIEQSANLRYSESEVYLNAFIENRQIVKDWPMLSFEEHDFGVIWEYPSRSWTTDEVFRLGREWFRKPDRSDQCIIRNISSRKINLIRIQVGSYTVKEQWLLFNQPSGVLKKISIFPQSNDDPDDISLAVRVWFEDGDNKVGMARFFNPGFRKGTGHYCVSINDKEISIASLEYQGLKEDYSTPGLNKDETTGIFYESPKTTRIPVLQGCGLAE